MIKTILVALVMILIIPNVVALEINLSDMEKENERPMPEMKLEKINSSAALLTITNPLEIPITAVIFNDIWALPEFYISTQGTFIEMEPGEIYEEIYYIEAKASTIDLEVRISLFV